MITTRRTESHGVPWETVNGYVQSIQRAAQMRQCYANAGTLLVRFGASLDDVVDDVVSVVDMEAASVAQARAAEREDRA